MSWANNIFLFTWESSYQIAQTLKSRKQKFAQKHWAHSIFVFVDPQIPVQNIQEAIFSWGLFASKKLIIIYWLPQDTDPAGKIWWSKAHEEFFLQNLDKIPQESVVIFVSYKPDKRTKLYKELLKVATIKEFKKSSPAQLAQYLRQNFPDLSEQVVNQIVQILWDDERRFFNEVSKLQWLDRKKITPGMIKEFFWWAQSFNIFSWLQKFQASTSQQKIRLINQLQIDEDPLASLGAILWSLKNTLVLLDGLQHWENIKSIASFFKIPPFVISQVQKNPQDLNTTQQLFEELFELWEQVKSGKIPLGNLSFFIKSTLLKIWNNSPSF